MEDDLAVVIEVLTEVATLVEEVAADKAGVIVMLEAE